MHVPTWIVAAASLIIPAISIAADGSSDAGKIKADQAGCGGCHGARGVATESGLSIDKSMPNLAAEPDLYIQFQLVFFRKGVRKNELMTAITESLSNEDIRNLGAFYASLPVPDTSQQPDSAPDDTRLGKEVAAAIHCTNCHGDHFEGVDNTARLAGQREDYLYKALHDFKLGARPVTGAANMAEVVYPLGDREMKALAHYLSQLR